MSSANSIICEEVFDETSNPSIDEIKIYASKIGIDPEHEPEFLPLAAEGLMKALPANWKPVFDENRKSYYYYNNVTGKTQWEHPLDGIYRGLVKKKRSESQSQSIGDQNEDATYNRGDDLPSFEENLTGITKVECLGAKKKEPIIKLSPLKFDTPKLLAKQKSEEKSITSIATKKIGLSLSTSFDHGKQDTSGDTPKKEFKLTRDGSMFLKRSKGESPDREDNKEQPRSILRERSFIIEPSKPEEDGKKNVRFSLNLDSVTISPKPSSLPETNNLKVVKPNPDDFLELKHKSESSAGISDSEDDSVLKSSDGRAIKREELVAKKISDDNLSFSKHNKGNADRDLESRKQSIWNENNEEINKYRHELQESQKSELERILRCEKEKYEENIKRELENLRIEMESRNVRALEQEKLKLEEELKKKKDELRRQFDNDDGLESIRKQFEERTNEMRKMQEEKLFDVELQLKRDLDKHKDELIVQHNAILDDIRKQHQSILETLKQDFKAEERIIRKEHGHQIAELKRKVNGSIDNEMTLSKDSGEERLYEKVRNEKRLLDDKYRCLKDKYLKLKTDVKISIDKRNRRREQNTTGSETERSNSLNKERSPYRSPARHAKPPIADPNSNVHQKAESKLAKSVIVKDADTSLSDRSFNKPESSGQAQNGDSSEDNANAARGRKKLYSRAKSSSATRNSTAKSKRSQPRTCSPVENLRRQLQKLEDLEDQLPPPHPPQSDTYHLRYPFSDGLKFEGSSELEFFRHRIHLERDSIKRAKESLRTQKCLFQQRQKDLKLKHGTMARHTLQQLCQEEKDLTDMEVSLHRTRSLLGEKVIRLRHLEQSLHRATAVSNDGPNKQEDTTLSDLSSHSASSGISSTEFATAADAFKSVLRGEHLQESSEIIQSLENLNLEIREIWEVLNQQHQAGNLASIMPAVPLVYPDLGWPMLAGTATVPAPPSIPTLADRLHNYRQHVALANAQSTVVTHAANQGATTTLVERTRNLRHWLRQAGIDPNAEGAAPQATL